MNYPTAPRCFGGFHFAAFSYAIVCGHLIVYFLENIIVSL